MDMKVISSLFLMVVISGVVNAQTNNLTTNTVTQLEPVVVTANKVVSDGSYVAPTAETGTRTDTPIAQTPLSIEVIPRDVIQDQNVFRMKDILHNVSGVAPTKDEGQGLQFENAYIRGFKQQTYLNGIMAGNSSSHAMPPVNMDGIQQIEVLKGPASTMYGAMEVGGVVNMVPRMADFNTTEHTVSAEFGSYNLYGGEMDMADRINKDLAYRVDSSYEESDSFRDFLHRKSAFVGPSLSWKVDEDTTATFWAWYQNLNRPVDAGIPFNSAGSPVGPITRNLSGPNSHNTQYVDDTVFGINLERTVTEELTFREKFMMHYCDMQMDAVRLNFQGSSTNPDPNTVTATYDNSSFNDLEFDSATEGVWKFDLDPTSHQILAGVEVSRSDYYYDGLTQSLGTINIYNPIYPTGNFHPTPAAHEQNTLSESQGFYLQDEMKALDDRLHFLLGGRMDHDHQFNAPSANVTGQNYRLDTRQEDLGFSGRAGLMYDVTPWMSPYMNICTSFNPSYGTTYDGQFLEPTTGLQYEGGIKYSLFEKKLLITTAAYQITKDNVVISDPDHPNGTGYYSMNGGTWRSQGVEYDMIGQITQELQVIGDYAYTDTAVIKSNSQTTSAPPVGTPFVGIPEHSGSCWLKYTFQDGPLKDFGIGTGTFVSSDFSANYAHTFNIPNYARWDAGAWYTYHISSGQDMKFQFNIVNLLDTTYYESVSEASAVGLVMPGAPLTVTGKVSVSF